MRHAALVTGGTGYIGQHLVARLVGDGRTVRVLTRTPPSAAAPPGVEFVAGEIRDPDAAARACAGVHTVFHLAGKAHDLREQGDTPEHAAVTVQGTANLVDAARLARVRSLVFVSSLAVYGAVGDGMHDESTPPRPVSAYGKAKLESEAIVREAGKRFGMHVACLRPAMVYGPGCKGQLPRLIRWIGRGVCPQVPELGTRRSVAHIDHLVDALVASAARPEADGRIYIVADPGAYSLHDMIDIIARALGRRPPRWTVPLAALRLAALAGDCGASVFRRRIGFDSIELDKLVRSAWFSGERIRRELDVHPTATLESAMPDIAASFVIAS